MQAMTTNQVSSLFDVEIVGGGHSHCQVWSTNIDRTLPPDNLIHVAMEHWEAISWLCDRVNMLSTAVPKVVQQLNASHRP